MKRIFLPLFFASLWTNLAFAQDPAKAPADLRYSEKLGKYHLVTWVALEVERDKYQKYQCDRYADARRIKEEGGATYAQSKSKPWLKSEDWGETGRPVSADKVAELEADAKIALIPFDKADPHDPSQGGTVWKLIEREARGDSEAFTYERSRERPHPDGVYPRFTFTKFKDAKDGELTLSFFTGQLRSGGRVIPVSIRVDYLLPLPPGTKVEFGVPPPKAKKR